MSDLAQIHAEDVGQTTHQELVQEALEKSRRLDQVHHEWKSAYLDAARKHAAYKRAWAQAIVTSKGKTVGERESLAELDTNTEREAHELSEAEAEIAKIAQVNLRKQLELLTAAAYLLRSESQMEGRR